MIENWSKGVFPLWNRFINLGLPFAADPQTETLYPFNLLYLILPFNIAFNLLMMLHYSLGGIFTFLFLRALKSSQYAAFLGALVFVFCGAINTRRGHVSVEYTLIWLPLLFYAYEKVKQTHSIRYIGLLSIAAALQFFAGFTQASFYSLLALGIYMFFSATQYANKKTWFKETCIFSVTFVSLILVQLVPTLSTASAVGRDRIPYDIFASYSLPFKNILALVNPLLMGFEYPGTPFPLFKTSYWGEENLTEFSLYVGILPIVLATALIFSKKKKPETLFWLGLASFTLVFSLGGNLPWIYKLLYHLPPLNSFRVPARMLVIFDFSLVVLFTLAINQIEKKNLSPSFLKKFFRLFALASFGLIVAANHFNKTSFTLPEAWIPLIMSIVFLIIAESDLTRWVTDNPILRILLAFLLVLDLWFFAFFNSNIFTTIKPSTSLANAVRTLDPENEYRILTIAGISGDMSYNFLGRNRNMLNHTRSLIGHTSFIPKVFMEALRCDEAGTFYDYEYFLRNIDLISALNTRWIILNNTEKKNPRYDMASKKFRFIKTHENYDIFENPDARRLVFNLRETVKSDANVIDKFDYKNIGLVKDDENVGTYPAKVAIGKINHDNGLIEVEVSSDGETFLGISETYTKHWKAFIDSSPAPIIKLNGLIMAVKVTAGNHQITLKYVPDHFFISAIISTLSWLIIIFFIFKPELFKLSSIKKELRNG